MVRSSWSLRKCITSDNYRDFSFEVRFMRIDVLQTFPKHVMYCRVHVIFSKGVSASMYDSVEQKLGWPKKLHAKLPPRRTKGIKVRNDLAPPVKSFSSGWTCIPSHDIGWWIGIPKKGYYCNSYKYIITKDSISKIQCYFQCLNA